MGKLRFPPLAYGMIPPLAALVVAVALACGSAATTVPAQLPEPESVAETTGDLEAIVATKSLNVGLQRVAFLLTTAKGLVKTPAAEVSSVVLVDGQAVKETKPAEFHLWPYGVRGSYVTEMNFNRPGPWRLDVTVDHEGIKRRAQILLDITVQGSVPQIGAIPPLSRNKTLDSVGSLEKLTTHYTPDADLYRITIEDAAATGKPTVVVFASPAFCTSPTCGPQTETLSELKDAHGGKANFIHVELYDNPDEIQGDLSRARLSQLVHDWGISALPDWFNESWTFVLDIDGKVAQRFEGFATLEELEEALGAVLSSG